jgi:hypothetical protein
LGEHDAVQNLGLLGECFVATCAGEDAKAEVSADFVADVPGGVDRPDEAVEVACFLVVEVVASSAL